MGADLDDLAHDDRAEARSVARHGGAFTVESAWQIFDFGAREMRWKGNGREMKRIRVGRGSDDEVGGKKTVREKKG